MRSLYIELQRAPIAATTTLGSSAYVARFAAEIGRDLMAALTTFSPPTGSDFATWKPLGSQLFLHRALQPFRSAGAELPRLLSDVLGFAEVKEAVNRGRDTADLDEAKGPPTYQGAVALELRRLMSARIAAPMVYLGPCYVAARHQVALRHEALQRSGVSDEPAVAALLPSNPLDPYLASSLVQNVLSVDLAAYRKSSPGELLLRDRRLRDIKFRFETEIGLKTSPSTSPWRTGEPEK